MGLVLLGTLILVKEGNLWASDYVLETVENGALIFPEEELVQKRVLVRDLLRLPFLASVITHADSRLILKILFP